MKQILLASLFCIAAGCGGKEYLVYYTPLEMNTAIRIEPRDIELSRVKFVCSRRELHKLFSSCSKSSARAASHDDYKLLRIEIVEVDSGRPLFITQDRLIVSVDKREVYVVGEDVKGPAINAILAEYVKRYPERAGGIPIPQNPIPVEGRP